MANASGVMKRHFTMLLAIPREPRKASVRDIEGAIRNMGGEVLHRRSIQRDLEKLQDLFPALHCDKRDKQYGWYWKRDAMRIGFPAMDGYTALSFRIMELYASDLLPPVVREHLKSYFTEAGSVLAQHAEGAVARWQNLVRVATRDVRRIPPRLSREMVTAVYDALFEGKRISVVYSPLDAGGPREPYELNPLALVLVGRVYYLLASAWNYSDVRQYALHRIRSAKKLATAAAPLAGFNIDDYLAAGEFEIPVTGRPVHLRIRAHAELAKHLAELPLAPDQQIKDGSSNRKIISATVNDTGQLRWWILSQGDYIEVLRPTRLRREITGTLQRTLAWYTHG